MRLVSILLPSRKDPRRRNLDPEEDKCRIQFPVRNRLLNLVEAVVDILPSIDILYSQIKVMYTSKKKDKKYLKTRVK